MIKRLISPETRKYIAARYFPTGFGSFSQSGEDRIINFFLITTGLTDATYFDAGCSHPIYGNNTYLLYRTGLRGICIDPSPGLADLYASLRPNDTFVPYALIPGDEDNVSMHFFEESTVNTISRDHADTYTKFGFARTSSLGVPAINFERLCSENNINPDVLCLDIEGVDYDVLASLTFQRLRPKLICVEVIRYLDDKTPIIDERFNDLLLTRGYMKYADTYINQFFADQNFIKNYRTI